MASDANVTVIGRAANVRGEISGTGDVQIEGTLEGSVHLTEARITVGPEANVRAALSAHEIVVHGRVEGELRATGRAELRAKSTVTGNIFAPRLAIEDNATLKGVVDCTPATKPPAGAPDRESQPAKSAATAGKNVQSVTQPAATEGPAA